MMRHLALHTHQSLARLLTLLVAICGYDAAVAQSEYIMTQYYEVPNLYNPAMAGYSDHMHVRAGARLQWTGVDDAPKTYALVADAPLRVANHRIGAGVIALKHDAGPYSSMQASAQIGAKVGWHGGELSLAIQAGWLGQRYKGSEADIPADDNIGDSQRIDAQAKAVDLGLGVAYTRANWYAALSCQHITSPSISVATSTESTAEEPIYRHRVKGALYFLTGCNIAVKNTLLEIMPSLIASTDFDSGHGVATVRMRYRRMLTAGVGYRFNEGVSLMLGAEIKNFYIGYSYDVCTSGAGKPSSGSHEAWLGYALKLDLSHKAKHRHRSVRYM